MAFGHPERSYYANQIVRFAGAGVGAVHRELQALAAAGLVTVSRVGNQKHYRANRDLCRRYGVRKLSLFGSAARGELTPGSDVDLMVEFKPESRVSLWDFPKLQEEFSDLFGNRRVELVPPEVMKNPFRRKTILPDLKVLYEA